MKSKLLAFLTLSAIVLGVVCGWQAQQLRTARARAVQVQTELESTKEASAEQERRANAAEQRQAALRDQMYEMSGLVAALRASAANTNRPKPDAAATETTSRADQEADESGLFGGKNVSRMLSKMMKDPAMKEMMRSQQKLAVNMMYGSLFKEMTLTSDEREKFTQLLLDQQMTSMEVGEKVLSEGAINVAAIAEQTDTKEPDDELKALLGEDRFAQYQDYKKEMSERMQVEQFRQQLAATDTALQEDQMKRLVKLMREEREQLPPEAPQDPAEVLANIETVFSSDFLEKHLQRQEEINRRVLNRAAGILTPDQLKSYSDFQAQQLNMQRLASKMTRDMFGPGSKK